MEVSTKKLSFDIRKTFPIFLAPMVGLSHVALKKLIMKYLPLNLPVLWPTEMLNSRRLPSERFETHFELQRDLREQWICPQLLGNEEDPICKSIQKLKDWGAVAIDINMGCPVTKALKHNYGVALMGDPRYAAQVVYWACRASDLPVSVKLRAGFRDDYEYLTDFVSGLFEAGASWVTIHPRLADQMRRGAADWSMIRRLKNDLKVFLIGNGDIQTVKDIFQRFDETGCDGVMIGRGLAAKPWLMADFAKKAGWGNPIHSVPESPEEEALEYLHNLGLFIETLAHLKIHENLAIRKVRFYVRMTHVWLNYGHEVLKWSNKYDTLTEMKETLSNLHKYQGFRMLPQTHLAQ